MFYALRLLESVNIKSDAKRCTRCLWWRRLVGERTKKKRDNPTVLYRKEEYPAKKIMLWLSHSEGVSVLYCKYITFNFLSISTKTPTPKSKQTHTVCVTHSPRGWAGWMAQLWCIDSRIDVVWFPGDSFDHSQNGPLLLGCCRLS